MSGVLLDTHVVLWLLDAPDRLGPDARRSIERGPACYSPISIVELTIKQMNGRISLPERFPDRVAESGLVSLPVTDRDAAAIADHPDLRAHDPFDRMLAAQASARSLGFLTVDRLLLGLGRDWIIDAAA